MEPNSDRRTARVVVDKTLTARELEQLIHELADLRSQMQPPVPTTKAGAIAVDAPMLVEPSGEFSATTTDSGGLRFVMRNSGLGWLAFELDAHAKEQLGNLILGKLTSRRTTQ